MIDVCHVAGLDSSVSGYTDQFTRARITGKQLLMMTNDDLERIGVNNLGHQEILLQSIALLQSLVIATTITTFTFVYQPIFPEFLHVRLNAFQQSTF